MSEFCSETRNIAGASPFLVMSGCPSFRVLQSLCYVSFCLAISLSDHNLYASACHVLAIDQCSVNKVDFWTLGLGEISLVCLAAKKKQLKWLSNRLQSLTTAPNARTVSGIVIFGEVGHTEREALDREKCRPRSRQPPNRRPMHKSHPEEYALLRSRVDCEPCACMCGLSRIAKKKHPEPQTFSLSPHALSKRTVSCMIAFCTLEPQRCSKQKKTDGRSSPSAP